MAMSTEKVLSALQLLEKVILQFEKTPQRMSEVQRATSSYEQPNFRRMQHLLFMVQEAQRMLLESTDRREKVMRWLGFLQGALYEMGHISIEGAKDMNRPVSG
jgi:hypothetical protein